MGECNEFDDLTKKKKNKSFWRKKIKEIILNFFLLSITNIYNVVYANKSYNKYTYTIHAVIITIYNTNRSHWDTVFIDYPHYLGRFLRLIPVRQIQATKLRVYFVSLYYAKFRLKK